MHIGKRSDICPDIYNDTWEVKCQETLDAARYVLVDSLGSKFKLPETEKE